MHTRLACIGIVHIVNAVSIVRTNANDIAMSTATTMAMLVLTQDPHNFLFHACIVRVVCESLEKKVNTQHSIEVLLCDCCSHFDFLSSSVFIIFHRFFSSKFKWYSAVAWLFLFFVLSGHLNGFFNVPGYLAWHGKLKMRKNGVKTISKTFSFDYGQCLAW